MEESVTASHQGKENVGISVTASHQGKPSMEVSVTASHQGLQNVEVSVTASHQGKQNVEESVTASYQGKPSMEVSVTASHQGKPSMEVSVTASHQGKPSMEVSVTASHQGKPSMEVSVTASHQASLYHLYRDTLIYAASLEPSGLRDSIDIMSDVVLRSNISQEELQGAVQAVAYDLEAMHMNPDPEMLLMEHIHKASFRDNTLGLPKFCPEENIGTIDKSQLHTYMKNFHTPSRMVIAGVGVPHDELVDLVQELFVEKKKPIWEEDAQLINPNKEADLSISQYTGGKVLVEKDLSSVSLGPNPMPELAHLVIGLESCSHRDDDFIAFCVLNMMMGGGGSFSAGGPGKGMFTRLYTYVLNRFHWIHSATAFNHAYEDGGVFCIHASADPKQLGSLTEVIVGELINTSRNIRNDELERAKTQLQSMLLMNLENRPVMFEDVGRQVLSRGSRRQPEYYFDEIGKITMDDVYRVVHRMMKSKPAIVGYGTLKNLPTYEKIQDSLLSNDGKSRKKIFNIF
ncbi:hypothetical protein FSP39_014459 [Pinctada imbricata]|uniref:Mitochondrial-processing peptidase subunit alpha n=1 Tax=Pinctada imbricata TaxID=66713 RepID=A0AA88XSY3_PINIB|nr:hypothetical protein FSP39_014459 [Pinctada imbricata]